MKFVVYLCLCVSVYAQSDYYLPWVPNNETFQSTIVIHNLGASTITLDLEATRTLTQRESQTLTIRRFESVRIPALELFPDLGEGAGYAVKISSASKRIMASCIISSTTTFSGDSPSQMSAIPASQSTQALSFNYLPVDEGFSAPVVVNVGARSTQLKFQAFQDGELIKTVFRQLGKGAVFADSMGNMFPELEGAFFVIVEGSENLVGASFLFNDLLEPALAPAIFLDETNHPETALSSFQIRADKVQVDVRDTVQLRVSGYRPILEESVNLTEQVTWTLSDESLASIDESGLLTTRRAGLLTVQAHYGESTDDIKINILGPRLKLSFAQSCYVEDDRCTYSTVGFFPGAPEPFTRFTSFNISISHTSRVAVGFFQLEALQQPFRISRVIARNSGSLFTSISGLSVGQTIQPGEVVKFACLTSLSDGETVDLEYIVEIEGYGPILNYTMEFSSN